jgi:hypothetical protein
MEPRNPFDFVPGGGDNHHVPHALGMVRPSPLMTFHER